MDEVNRHRFFSLATDTACIELIDASAEKYASLHKSVEGSICVATPAALLKFDIPALLPALD